MRTKYQEAVNDCRAAALLADKLASKASNLETRDWFESVAKEWSAIAFRIQRRKQTTPKPQPLNNAVPAPPPRVRSISVDLGIGVIARPETKTV